MPVRESPRKRKRNEITGDTSKASSLPNKREKRVSHPPEATGEENKQDTTNSGSVHVTKKTGTANTPVAGNKGRKKAKDDNLEVAQETHIEDSKDGIIVKEKADIDGIEDKIQKPSRKRKTKEEKEAEAMPLAARTTGLRMYVGAHVSIAKGVENAITNALHIGGNAFALFLKSQRKWENPALKNENRDAFRSQCNHHKYDSMSHVVPHGSYLVNLATPHEDKAKQSYDAFVDDLHRCESLGIKYYNFHPGATNQEPLAEAIGRLAANLNRALAETSTVIPLLENMAGSGSIIGSKFSDLRDIIAQIKPEYKSRIGVCIDTCHTFAAGYDLRSPEAYKKTMKELDDVIGLKYLRALHMNDSKAPLNSKRDLHQNIGAGFLGLRAFHNIMNDSRLENIPLVLETPCERPDPADTTGKKTIDDKNVWAREIKLLESLIGMDPEGDEFRKLEADLSEQGRAERDKMSAAIATKEEKANKKATKEREKNQKSVADMFGGQSSKTKGKRKGKSPQSSSSELSELDSDS